jgi:hypothetical protein
MKTLIYRQLTRQVIPDGEGFTALPISFINVIARIGFSPTKQSP